jgi:predicted O-methyltransferase YrrM
LGAIMSGYEIEALQDEAEISRWAAIVAETSAPGSYLEIGSKFGGSLWRVAKAMPVGSLIVAVDLPNGTKLWKQSQASLLACIERLKKDGYNARVLWGDSTDPKIVDQVLAYAPFDAVLIDANHTLPYVEKDWVNYSPMARIVAFHDIAWRRAPDWVGTRIDVPEFWQQVKQQYRHEEIKHCPTGKNNGIGVLWRW